MQMAATSVEPIEKNLSLKVPRAFAFRIFTEEIHMWWPAETHSVAAGQGGLPQGIVIEPQTGGRIYEVLPDGCHCDWGKVTDWQPPERLSFIWHPGHPETRATIVHVDFIEVGASETQVRLRHEGWDQIEGGAEVRQQYVPGWDHVLLDCYGGAVRAHHQEQT
ncbi:SRPBCC domain-containing protein [Thalassobius sp. MITS945101]|uniref:SRPBCC domain-containing protein n=1 Tax=Thalassobius sp. MITS945101 TaxID=3096994 RepID=UPI00399974D3